MLRRRSEDEKEAQRREKELKAQRKDLERERDAFRATPAGQARTAFDRGDSIFQCSLSVVDTEAIVVPMVGARAAQTTSDPTVIVNSVCTEGWSLVNGSFVFLELGSESRDKFLSSGQNIAVKGTILGYYLFRRDESARRETARMRWEVELPGLLAEEAKIATEGRPSPS